MAGEKERVALSSILASGGLTVAKGIVGFATGSLAILTDAAHSLIDLLATVMTYFAVRVGDKPADAEHHYGHGKIESISALAETALLFVLAGIVIWEAGHRLWEGSHEVEATPTAFAVIVGAIAVDFFRSRALTRIAHKTSSEALHADALHFSSDLWASVAVLIGLGGIALGFSWADSVAAIAVSVLICIAAWKLGRKTIDTLTDTAPEGIAERVRSLLARVKGVVAVERVRARKVGPTTFVDLEVATSRTLPLDRVAAIKDEIVRRLRAELGESETAVTVVPRALDNETVLERVMVIARNLALPVHHVTVHAIGNKLSVSLDLEVDGSMPLGAAHEIASRLEGAINDELGPDVEVETHIEPLQVEDMAGHDAPPERIGAVEAALATIAGRLGAVHDVHDVRMRETADGEIVNFHCWVDPALSVHDVHEKVDALERGLRNTFPSIKRVIGHAEPGTQST
jgi:cation diffusion facilitator family transporter